MRDTPPKLSIILHNIRSVFNVGALFRTAEAVGAGKIWLTGYTPGPDTHPEKMEKTALGAQANLPWGRVRRAGDLLHKFREKGVAVVALERTKKSIDYRVFKPVFPLALIVGNEVKGVSARMSHNVDTIIEIPMRGKKESLNVVVATGIALYELTRRWK